MGGPGHGRRLAAATVLAALLGGPACLVLEPLLAPVAAASPQALAVSADAAYVLDSAASVVHVSVSVRATNVESSTTTGSTVTRYYFTGIRLAIQPEATHIAASDGFGALPVVTSPRQGAIALEADFRSNLFYHQSTSLRISYDLVGAAPRSTTSEVRINAAFASFSAWAYGDPGSSTVRIELPASFVPSFAGEALARSSVGGSTVLAARAIAQPDSWAVDITADRTAALDTTRLTAAAGQSVVVRSWPGDTVWATKVHDLLQAGLPRLDALVRLPWPVTGDLVVTEVATPLLEGYSGIYHAATDTISISEDLDDLTIVHEASHAWFNPALFSDRWITEGLADEYGSLVLDELALTHESPTRPTPSDPGRVALASWAFPGAITTTTTDERETYGYDASWWVSQQLLADIGPAKMADVFAAAAYHRIAYLGSGAAETTSGPNDWRRYLDLLDEVGGATAADALFRAYVADGPDTAELDARTAARGDYAALGRASKGWPVPLNIRTAMSSWSFAPAERLMAAAGTVTREAASVAAAASRLGVKAPADLEAAYEAATTDFGAPTALADRELAALEVMSAAKAAYDAPRDVVATIGMNAGSAAADWSTAGTEFADGDLVGATEAAQRLAADLRGAPGLGRSRLLAGTLLLILGIALAAILMRRRGRPAAVSRESRAPYGTLADHPAGDRDEGAS